jgi:Family of unknown function (DUF6152)
MIRHVRVKWLACMAALMATAATAVRAQQPTAEYYVTAKTVTIKGTVRLTLVVPPPTPMIIGLEVKGANGQKEMWFLTGNPATALRRDGWQLIGLAPAIKSGDEIAVTAYLPKDEQKAAKALGAVVRMPSAGGEPSGPPGFIADIEAKRARLAYGLEITKADGQKLRFGDAP